MKNKIAVPIATWFGCGYAPKAPGTVGSAAAVAVAWALSEYAGLTPPWFAVLAVASTPAAMWASGATARYLKTKDPGVVVVDEVVGQWMTFAGAGALNWKTYLAGFVLFRLFDILKPPPVRQLEKLPGGVGIVADDIGAGAYAALVLFLAQCFNL
jgi:phosphatidylglycerophosphatase A